MKTKISDFESSLFSIESAIVNFHFAKAVRPIFTANSVVQFNYAPYESSSPLSFVGSPESHQNSELPDLGSKYSLLLGNRLTPAPPYRLFPPIDPGLPGSQDSWSFCCYFTAGTLFGTFLQICRNVYLYTKKLAFISAWKGYAF